MQLLLIAVALICAYLACWGSTKKRAYQCITTQGFIFSPPGWEQQPLGKESWVEDAASPLPLIISQDEMNDDWSKSRRYYAWVFGPAFKLPFERPVEPGIGN